MKIIETNKLTPDSLPTYDEQLHVYNGLDCCVTLEIFEVLDKQLDNVSRNTYNFSLALQAPILEMNMAGVLVDHYEKNRLIEAYEREQTLVRANLDKIILGAFDDRINPASPADLTRLFYAVMGLPPVRKRKPDGSYGTTTNREALEKLSAYLIAEPIIAHILLLRDLGKRISFLRTGIDADGHMRTSFNIAGTNTGRLSSALSDFGTGTNLQNIERRLRRVFIAKPGYKFANIDLEQADARNVGALLINFFYKHPAYAAGCSAYLDACESGDLHTAVCRMAWTELPWNGDQKHDRAIADGKAYRDLSYRDLAKKLGHGTNYYGQPATMARHTKVDRAAIELFQRRYFEAFPHIRYWHDRTRSELQLSGSLTTPFGRRRRFFGRRDDDSTLREAIAYEPQSMTADEIDTGLLKVWRADLAECLIQVHDSILFQYPAHLENQILPQLIAAIETPITLANGRQFTVPAEAKIGWNWADFDDKNPLDNPDGLMKFRGNDERVRAKAINFMDRVVQ